MLFILWLILTLLYLVAVVKFIPTNNLQKHKVYAISWEQRVAHICWYTPAVLWFFIPASTSAGNIVAGVFLYMAGALLAFSAQYSNPFFSPAIRRPSRRITTGAYAWFDHPAYLGWSAMGFGTVLILGQWWGLVSWTLYVGILVSRAIRENRLLRTLEI